MKNIPKKKGRWLSALLAGCLLLSIVPATAFAAEDTTEGKGVTAEAAQTPGQEGDTKGGTPDLEEDTADTENTKNAEDPASDPTTEKKDATVEDSKTSGQPNTVEDSKTSGQPNTVEDSKTSGQPDAAAQSTAENASHAQGKDTDAAG